VPPLLQLLVLMVLVMLLQPRPLIRPGEGGWASLDCPTGPADQRLGSKMAIGRSGRGRATSPARCRRRRRLRRTPCHAMPCRAMPCPSMMQARTHSQPGGDTLIMRRLVAHSHLLAHLALPMCPLVTPRRDAGLVFALLLQGPPLSPPSPSMPPLQAPDAGTRAACLYQIRNYCVVSQREGRVEGEPPERPLHPKSFPPRAAAPPLGRRTWEAPVAPRAADKECPPVAGQGPCRRTERQPHGASTMTTFGLLGCNVATGYCLLAGRATAAATARWPC